VAIGLSIYELEIPWLENLLGYYRKSDGATRRRGRNREGEMGRKEVWRI